jgi:hypothetical protein
VTLAMQFVPAAGLSPPGSISVAPSGIPAPLAPLEPGTPSGDVAPRPGAVINVWASAAPQPSAVATAITSKRCMDVSSALNADGSGQCARASRDKTLARWIGLDPPHLEMVEAARSCSLEIAEDGLRLPFAGTREQLAVGRRAVLEAQSCGNARRNGQAPIPAERYVVAATMQGGQRLSGAARHRRSEECP